MIFNCFLMQMWIHTRFLRYAYFTAYFLIFLRHIFTANVYGIFLLCIFTVYFYGILLRHISPYWASAGRVGRRVDPEACDKEVYKRSHPFLLFFASGCCLSYKAQGYQNPLSLASGMQVLPTIFQLERFQKEVDALDSNAKAIHVFFPDFLKISLCGFSLCGFPFP